MPSSAVCAVSTCKNASFRRVGTDITYHKFPSDPIMFNQWVAACNTTAKVNKYSRICSEHFLPEDYDVMVLVMHELQGTPCKRTLKCDVVPSQKLPVGAPTHNCVVHRTTNTADEEQVVYLAVVPNAYDSPGRIYPAGQTQFCSREPMSLSCAVAGCENNGANTSGTEIFYHRFPKDPIVCKQWVMKCDKPEKVNLNSALMCSEHFQSDDYERDLQSEMLGLPALRILKPGAAPSLKLRVEATNNDPAVPSVTNHPEFDKVLIIGEGSPDPTSSAGTSSEFRPQLVQWPEEEYSTRVKCHAVGQTCCVSTCPNSHFGQRDHGHKSQVDYFSFPTDPKQLFLWMKAILRPGYAQICSSHFLEDHVIPADPLEDDPLADKAQLKEDALPLLNLPTFAECLVEDILSLSESNGPPAATSKGLTHLNEDTRLIFYDPVQPSIPGSLADVTQEDIKLFVSEPFGTPQNASVERHLSQVAENMSSNPTSTCTEAVGMENEMLEHLKRNFRSISCKKRHTMEKDTSPTTMPALSLGEIKHEEMELDASPFLHVNVENFDSKPLTPMTVDSTFAEAGGQQNQLLGNLQENITSKSYKKRHNGENTSLTTMPTLSLEEVNRAAEQLKEEMEMDADLSLPASIENINSMLLTPVKVDTYSDDDDYMRNDELQGKKRQKTNSEPNEITATESTELRMSTRAPDQPTDSTRSATSLKKKLIGEEEASPTTMPALRLEKINEAAQQKKQEMLDHPLPSLPAGVNSYDSMLLSLVTDDTSFDSDGVSIPENDNDSGVDQVIRVKVRLHTCSYCGMFFSTKTNLSVHMDVMHREFRCSKCKKGFRDEHKLVKHLRKGCQIKQYVRPAMPGNFFRRDESLQEEGELPPRGEGKRKKETEVVTPALKENNQPLPILEYISTQYLQPNSPTSCDPVQSESPVVKSLPSTSEPNKLPADQSADVQEAAPVLLKPTRTYMRRVREDKRVIEKLKV